VASTWTFAVPTERGLGSAAGAIRAIVDVASGPSVDKLEDALEKVETALVEFGKSPPDRVAALGNVEGAVGDLEASVSEGLIDAGAGAELMARMSEVALVIAEDAIAEAEARPGADPDEISQAKQERDDGNDARVAGQFKVAIAKYRAALAKAEGA
jgi:predicted RNase H-like HicB family nuclease